MYAYIYVYIVCISSIQRDPPSLSVKISNKGMSDINGLANRVN